MAHILRATRAACHARIVDGEVHSAQQAAQALRDAAKRRAETLAVDIQKSAERAAKAALAAEYAQLGRLQQAQIAALEAQVVEVAMATAARLLGEQLSLDPARIVGIVKQMLAKIPQAARVTIYLHPDDRAAFEIWLAQVDAPNALQVASHADIARGGCVVESDVGDLDARVETRLDALRTQWTGAIAIADNNTED